MDVKSTKVSDLMNTDVRYTDKNNSILNVGKEMLDKKVSSFIIKPDNECDAYGIITRKDVVEALVNPHLGEVSVRVKDIMTKPAITINPGLSIFVCHQTMLMVGARRLPVVDGNRLVGIISNSDLLKYLVEE